MRKRTRVIGIVALAAGALAATASAATASQYVALGDSYSSGVGTRVFYSESGSCKRSPEAYGPKIAAEGKTCNVNFLTSSNEKKLNETGDKLDAVVKARAEGHGFTYVDPRAAFSTHEVCSSSEWLNGQSNPLEESYHPNISGQADFTSQIEGVL